MSKRITLDNLKTFLTQLKTNITDPITNDVSTLTTKVRNAENNIITANSNISSVQQALKDKADKNHNHDSVYVKQDGSTPITSRQQLKMGSYVFESHAGDGTEGYALIAEFKILRNYQNTPIKIELARRGVLYSNITIQFTNTNSPDPTLQNFVYEGSDCMAYMVKADTSTWNLYIRKTEGYDVIFITKYSNPNSAITTTWKESVVTSLQDGGTYATPLQHSISEITDLQTILDKKAPINNKFALQVNVKHYINNSELLTYVDADNTQMQFKKSGLYKITVTKANNQTSGISFCDTSIDFETKGNVLVGYNVGLYEPVSSNLVMYIDKTKTYEFFGFVLSEYHGATSYTKYRGAEFKTKLQGSNILIELIKEC